jgi:hypothetical protein
VLKGEIIMPTKKSKGPKGRRNDESFLVKLMSLNLLSFQLKSSCCREHSVLFCFSDTSLSPLSFNIVQIKNLNFFSSFFFFL